MSKEKEYRVGVDVTRSIWVTVTASSESNAETLGEVEAEALSTVGEGAWVKNEVHSIYSLHKGFGNQCLQSNGGKNV